MLYHFYLWLTSDYSIGKALGVVLLLAIVFGMARIGLLAILRGLLFLYATIELYLMSPGYACSYGTIFPRAETMSGMCQGSHAYTIYLNQNFGLNLWYMQIFYGMLILFAIWPLIERIRDALRSDKFQREDDLRLSKMRAEDAARIQSIDKVGSV